jgi:hypothetical protein
VCAAAGAYIKIKKREPPILIERERDRVRERKAPLKKAVLNINEAENNV